MGGTAVTGACLEPLNPDPLEPSALIVQAGPVEDDYQFRFLHSRQEVSQLRFGQPVMLQAIIKDASDAPAQKGLVVFQYCSLKGRPPNDINRIDEAPLEACEVTGEGAWANLGSVSVNGSGVAEREVCCHLFTPTIGFRYKYLGQGSGIMNWAIIPQNFNWIE